MPMYPENMFFTSESVAEGHPDKVCDQVPGRHLRRPTAPLLCARVVEWPGPDCEGTAVRSHQQRRQPR
ncbi:MAG: hypothetical protein IPF53_18080 [Blastocatellia bacterium]|nr:hypothetical protein [Blastocatellia bacterium]